MQKLDYTDEAWWVPPAFAMADEQLAQLRDIVASADLQDYFYPHAPPKSISRRYKQFRIEPVLNHCAGCLGYGRLDVLIDEKYHQALMIGSGSSGERVFARLPDLRPETLWPSIKAYLLTGGPLDGVITAKEDFQFDFQASEPWEHAIWISDFWFFGNAELQSRFRELLDDLYMHAPDECGLKQDVAPTAEAWCERNGIA